MSTSVHLSTNWLLVPCLVSLALGRRRRKAGLARGADVPHDRRLDVPSWFWIAVIAANALFTFAVILMDAVA